MVSLLDVEGGEGGAHSLSTFLEGAHSLSIIFGLSLVALIFILLGTSKGGDASIQLVSWPYVLLWLL